MSSTAPDVDSSGAPKRGAGVRVSPPPSPVDIDGVPLRDGRRIDLKHVLGHMPDVDDDDDDDGAATAAGGDDAAAAAAASLIESQFQPVDDDDLVFGEPDDDEEEAAATGVDGAAAEPPVQRKRRSSMKRCCMAAQAPADHPESPPPAPDSPPPDHSQKAVRFADAVGLGLADVRDLVDTDEPPTIPASALRDLHVRRRKRSKSHLAYSIDFSQPGSDPTFITRVLADKVSISVLYYTILLHTYILYIQL